jgi:hypothetical protein
MTPKSEEKKQMPVKNGSVELENLVSEEEQDSLVVAIRDIVLATRQRIANNVNLTMIASNWQIGYCIGIIGNIPLSEYSGYGFL